MTCCLRDLENIMNLQFNKKKQKDFFLELEDFYKDKKIEIIKIYELELQKEGLSIVKEFDIPENAYINKGNENISINIKYIN